MRRRMLAWLGFTLLGIALVQPAAAQKKAPEASAGGNFGRRRQVGRADR